MDLGQARHFVGPDLDPNHLRRLTADDTSRQRILTIMFVGTIKSISPLGLGMHSLFACKCGGPDQNLRPDYESKLFDTDATVGIKDRSTLFSILI